MTAAIQTDGLLTCVYCQDDKRYTRAGIISHLTKIHNRRICPVCGVDIQVWPFREPHYCEPRTERAK